MTENTINNTENIINNKYSELLSVCNDFSVEEKLLIDKAFNIAIILLHGETRENGDPFIFHAISIAQIIVSDLGLSATSVVATFLHEAGAKSEEPIDAQPFGNEVSRIVEGLNKISKIDIKATSLQVDNFRKLIVSYSSDPRVTLIKLADRLEVMRSLSFFSPMKQMQKATETQLLYAPLAHQLGLYNLKGELENLAFKYTDNLSYRLVTNKLKSTTGEREKFIKDFIKPIEVELKKRNYEYSIKSRTKTAYSIWRKMQKQKVDFEGVYDVFAIRVIIENSFENIEAEQKACFDIYSIVANIYKPDEKRFRDWITRPKKTGYESLHTTVQTLSGRFVEVQIRTHRMDEIAEKGAAAHWKYKGIKQIQSTQNWLDNVRRLLEESKIESSNNLTKINETEIYVFTPNGDLRRLPIAATVLDFAFEIHTNIGAHCIGARVNGHNATIREQLKTGDVVEISTSKNQTPNADWLNFVVTSKAKTKIRAKLREEEAKVAQVGREMIERRLKNWKLSTYEETITELTKYFKLKQGTEFYAQLGSEKISLSEVKDALQKLFVTPEEKQAENVPVVATETKSANKQTSSDGNDFLVIDDKLQGLTYHLAKCCNPIKGDDIFGFVTINSGIKIHRITCPNAARLLDKYPYRVVKAKWKEDREGSFLATIRISGSDEIGMLNRITEAVQQIGVNMRSVNISLQSAGVFEGKIQVSISGAKMLDFLLHRLQQIKGVSKVQRIV